MYEAFYGLREKPFSLTPDPQFLYMSSGHDNALVHLRYALKENKGFVVITGEVGSGKTTLMNFLLRTVLRNAQVAMVSHTSLSPIEFVRMICEEFELETAGLDKAGMLMRFHEFLLGQFSRRRRVVLIVDEAQNLPLQTIEEIRMLSNLESEKAPLLQVLLVGQPELKLILERRELEQFAQRVSVTCHLGALSREELGEYILHRLKVAGASRLDLFDQGAMDAVHELSQGIPRLVNILCDTALVCGFADDLQTIGRSLIEEAAKTRKMGDELKPGKQGFAGSNHAIGGQASRGDFAQDQRLRAIESMVADLNQQVLGWMDRERSLSLLMREVLKEIKEIRKEKAERNDEPKSRPIFSMFAKRR
jgi:general secretion pathway protein A